MNFENLQRQDCQRFYQAFYSYFDHSAVINFIKDYQNLGEKAARSLLIGEGRHFRALLLNPSHRPPEGALVVSMARVPEKSEKERENLRVTQWVRQMKRLSSLRIKAIPPFELLTTPSGLALVTLYGDADAKLVAPHWTPLPGTLGALEQELAAHKLCIDDQLQVRVWQGIPFVCDLSDLKRL